MKNRLISGILFIILGSLIAWGPQTFFPVCPTPIEETSAGDSGKMNEQKSMSMGSHGMEQAAEAEHGEGFMNPSADMVMKCHWTSRAELGIGSLIALLGVLLIAFQSRQVRLGLSLSLILNGILALLIPTALIGVCDGAHMICRSLALPALSILSGLVVVISIANVVYLYKSNEGNER